MRKLTQEEFIKKAIAVHGNRYDYSKVVYEGRKKHIVVTCPVHGDFMVTPESHLSGSQCPYCQGKVVTTESFIKKAIEVHGNKYDYSKVQYVNAHTKVCIICPKHGEFWQIPYSHLKGFGCEECAHRVIDTARFISDASQIHNNFYQYSNTIYINSHRKVWVTCPKHGDFLIPPLAHLNGKKCPKCILEDGNTLRYTTEEWIEQARKVHGDKYNYSKTNYLGSDEKLCIICSKHGEFWQKASAHLSGCGCPKCARQETEKGRLRALAVRFLKKAKQKYNNKFDYSHVEYVDQYTPVKIICPIHGEFYQAPINHLRAGCAKCSAEYTANINRKLVSEFIQESRSIHGDTYDYSLVQYKNNRTAVKIICPKHGIFEQRPSTHLHGSGCPKCRLKAQTKLFNKLCEIFPDQIFIFEANIKNIPWISNLRIDIYMPELNIAIEYDGPQHFEEVTIWKRDPIKLLESTQARDKLKQQLCEQNNCLLLRLKYNYTKDEFEHVINQIKNRINNGNNT